MAGGAYFAVFSIREQQGAGNVHKQCFNVTAFAGRKEG